MTTTPFLGCKISLISKSEIRYEGILYTIDPKESTIALAKVRSYGTEDRPAERQVPPREEIFEYIIFRAGDIKDLIVDDPPTSINPGLADPAIIQAHSTSNTSGATFPSSTFPQMTTSSSITTANAGQRPTGPPFQSATSAINSLASSLGAVTLSQNAIHSLESRSGNSTPTGGGSRVKSPQNDGSTQTSATKPIMSRDNRQRSGERGAQHHYRRGGQQNYNQSYAQRDHRDHRDHREHRDDRDGRDNRDIRDNRDNRRGSGQFNNYRQNNYQKPSQPVSGRFGYNNRQYGYSSNNNRRPPMQSRPNTQRGSQNRGNVRPKDPIKFDSEFDFDKAEQEFKQLEEKLTNLKVEPIEKPKDEENDKELLNNTNEGSTNGGQDKEDDNALDPFYDKGKSFFDKISCEALEREKGNVQRIDWKAERKLNSETFGVPVSYRRIGYRGRGYNRGYGYQNRNNRGGYGGGIRVGGGGDTRRFNGPQHRN